MKRYLTIAALALSTAAGLGVWTSQSGTAGLPTLVTAAQAAETGTVMEMSLGQKDAPVEIIEYASFTCGHCAHFNETVFKDLKKDYIDTGKVHFIYRDVYFDRYGLWAAMVARCGGEMRFFGIKDMLFAELGDWAKGEPAEIADNLRRIGRKAGLDDDQLNACLQDAETAQTLVAWYEENAKKDGINATPTFIIDGEKYSNMGYDEFQKLIDAKLAD